MIFIYIVAINTNTLLVQGVNKPPISPGRKKAISSARKKSFLSRDPTDVQPHHPTLCTGEVSKIKCDNTFAGTMLCAFVN